MDQLHFADRIKTARKELGLTQQELAERLHVTNKAVSKWERALSFPDITLLPELSEILHISLYELMGGEPADEQQPILPEQVDKVLQGTVQEVGNRQRNQKRRWRLAFAAQGILLAAVICLFLFGKDLINFMLDQATAPLDRPYHSSEVTVEYPAAPGDGSDRFAIAPAPSPAAHIYPYSIFHVDEDGQERLLFTLREQGMALDHAPRLTWDEDYLYVIFDGLDNEDPVERVYGDRVGASPQKFLPHLFRYDRGTGMVEELSLRKPGNSLLLDAFTREGETVYLEARFKGLVGGLNLGIYQPDGVYFSDGSVFDVDLVGEGGLQTSGVLVGSSYYVCGQEGVYCYETEGRTFRRVAEMDFRMCLTTALDYDPSKSELIVTYTELPDPDKQKQAVVDIDTPV